MNYVGVAGGWGGAMVSDNIYQTSLCFDVNGCYETTFQMVSDGEYGYNMTQFIRKSE